MNPGARSIVLTESQAACLVALRLRKEFKTEIAIQAKLDLKKATVALDALKELGLARRGAMSSWHPTRRGRNCRFKATPDRIRRGSALPGPGARRATNGGPPRDCEDAGAGRDPGRGYGNRYR